MVTVRVEVALEPAMKGNPVPMTSIFYPPLELPVYRLREVMVGAVV